MLAIILIYFVWKKFADLAFEYDKNRWGYGILGVVSYYFGYFLFAFCLGIFGAMGWINIEGVNDLLVGLMCIPSAVLFCVLTYRTLNAMWSKGRTANEENLSDIIDQNLPK